MLQIEWGLAQDIVRMNGHIGSRAAVFHPADRAEVVPVSSGTPGVTAVAVDPGSCVAYRPVVAVRTDGGVGGQYRFASGHRISGDKATDVVW